MNLSNETVSVLKNFATINQNLVIKAGSSISTMSAMKNIVATAEVKEVFPTEFAIYDLNEFLAALSLFEKPSLDFNNDFVVMTENGTSLKYWYSDPSVVNFSFANDLLSNVQKAAAVIGVPDMVLEGTDSGVASLKVTDKKNATANAYDVKVDVNNQDGKNLPYKFWFKVENLKLLSGTYDVSISSKNISHFVNANVDIKYWIALEPESKYDA